ncbi:MAG: hypothetical protein V4440_00365 [Pseudomonadota bacterium]
MAITSATRDWGTSGPNIVRITATNTLAEMAASGYVDTQADELAALNSGTWEWLVGDLIAAAASDGSEFFRFDGDDFSTFEQLPGGNGEVTLPVVSGNFAVFDGTLGALEDLGYLPSDASKTRVVMAGSAVQVGYLAHFIDTTGTIDDTAGAVINAGNIQAGLSGTAGTHISYPAGATSGTLILAAATNGSGNFSTTISNATAVGQSQVVSIPDGGAATNTFVLASMVGGQSVSSATSSATPGTVRAFKGLMTGTGTPITSGNLVGVRGEVDYVSASGGFMYGVQGKIIPTGTLSGSSWNAGVFGQLDISAATINAGQVAPIWGDYGASSGTLTNQTGLYGIAMTNTTAVVTAAQLYLYGGASALMKLETNAGLSGVTYYIDAGTGAGSWGNATPPTPTKVLKITVDGTAYYLPLVAQNT